MYIPVTSYIGVLIFVLQLPSTEEIDEEIVDKTIKNKKIDENNF